MKTCVVVVHAEREPMEGIPNPGPHQIYRHPHVSVETRTLGALHPDELRVKMLYVGVCGTDVHVVGEHPETGYIRSSAPASIPEQGRIIGHEGVGQVLEAGSNVTHLQAGDYVTFESIHICHVCDVCRRGRFNQCRNAKLVGLERDGLFGTVVDVPALLAHNVNVLSDTEQGLQAAACVEPAGVAYVSCQNVNMRGGDVVAIFGAGPIGMLAALLSKTVFGASEVHIVEPVPFRREFARKWSDQVYDVDEFFTDPPNHIDVVIEASGALDNVNRVLRRVNANGRIALLARSGVPLAVEAVDHIITNEISIIGSRGHLCGAFVDILRLYACGRLPLNDVVTGVIEGMDALCDLLREPDAIVTDHCKVLVRLNKGEEEQ